MSGVPPTAPPVYPPTCTGCCMGPGQTLEEAQRLCMDSAFRWVKPSSERGKGVANYISLFEVAAMGRLRAPMEEEDPTEGGSLKEDHL